MRLDPLAHNNRLSKMPSSREHQAEDSQRNWKSAPAHRALSFSSWIGFLCLCFGLALLSPTRAEAAFGLSNNNGLYTVDTGAGLVFSVRQSNGDISSLRFNNIEYQDPTRGSHINSGLGTSIVTAKTYGADTIKIDVVAGTLTHYYLARRGFNNI